MKVYCYAKCGTCRKALKWLDDRQIEYEKIDIAQDHPDEAMIRELHKKSGLLSKSFSGKSMLPFITSLNFIFFSGFPGDLTLIIYGTPFFIFSAAISIGIFLHFAHLP